MAFLELEDLRKAYGAQNVVQQFALSVQRGEFVSFLGPSGCGKTTTLRMVAGFEIPSEGQIRINDREITYLRPNQRNVGMVFQSYALFPNMTVAQNIAFGLKVAKREAAEIEGRVAEMLKIIKLPQHGGRYPYQLSGGQQQRVALARALAGGRCREREDHHRRPADRGRARHGRPADRRGALGGAPAGGDPS